MRTVQYYADELNNRNSAFFANDPLTYAALKMAEQMQLDIETARAEIQDEKMLTWELPKNTFTITPKLAPGYIRRKILGE